VDENGSNNINGSKLAYFDDSKHGANAKNHAYLLTPSVNLSTQTATYLEFDYNFREVNSLNDTFYVDIYSQSSWQRIFSETINNKGKYSGSGTFPHVKVDISNYADSNVQIRFGYDDGNGWGFNAGIDNVKLYSRVKKDIGISGILSPTSGCQGVGKDSVTVLINNYGLDTIRNFRLVCDINKGAQVLIDTVHDPIPPADTLVYTFKQTVNLPTPQVYELQLYTRLLQDTVSWNDTFATSITHTPTYSLPYTESFESANHGWTIGGTNSSWEWGVPGGHTIDTAAHEQMAFVTNLDSTYNSNELSYLTSPCFDLSTITYDPILSFDLNYQTERNYDHVWIEYSLNNGKNWQKIPRDSLQLKWYNHTTQKGWSGNSNGWVSVYNELKGMAGKSGVQFRFVFDSDVLTVMEGVGIDHVQLKEKIPYDLALRSLRLDTIPDSSDCPVSWVNLEFDVLNRGVYSADTFKLCYRINKGPVLCESIFSKIMPKVSRKITHAIPYDIATIDKLNISGWSTFPADSNRSNDTLKRQIYNGKSITLPLLIDFEGFNINTNCITNIQLLNPPFKWDFTPTHNYWMIGDHQNCHYGSNMGATVIVRSGPDSAAFGSKFIYFDSRADSGSFTLKCINLRGHNQAELSFYYHKFIQFSTIMEDLFIDVSTPGGWVTVDSVMGKTHTSHADPWDSLVVSLDSFMGGEIDIRFRIDEKTGGSYTSIALDHIKIYDPTLVTNKEKPLPNGNKFTIYPNPSRGRFTIEAAEEFIGSYYQLTDLNGKVLHRAKLKGNQNLLNMDFLARGIYFFRIENSVIQQKLIIY
jgi:hypothetical protein